MSVSRNKLNIPKIAVLIPTYNRPAIVATCIRRLYHNLTYNGRVHFYVGIDGNVNATRGALDKLPIDDLYLIDGPNKGLGANLNNLLQATEDYDILMSLDDDHILKGLLVLTPHVKHLMDNEEAGWIRLYGIGHHHYKAELLGVYWYVDWDSPFLYVPSFRPHIYHKRFHSTFGMFPENLPLGETEEAWCHQCKDKAKVIENLYPDAIIPKVLVPLNHNDNMFDHVGHSWQSKGK